MHKKIVEKDYKKKKKNCLAGVAQGPSSVDKAFSFENADNAGHDVMSNHLPSIFFP